MRWAASSEEVHMEKNLLFIAEEHDQCLAQPFDRILRPLGGSAVPQSPSEVLAFTSAADFASVHVVVCDCHSVDLPHHVAEHLRKLGFKGKLLFMGWGPYRTAWHIRPLLDSQMVDGFLETLTCMDDLESQFLPFLEDETPVSTN